MCASGKLSCAPIKSSFQSSNYAKNGEKKTKEKEMHDKCENKEWMEKAMKEDGNMGRNEGRERRRGKIKMLKI